MIDPQVSIQPVAVATWNRYHDGGEVRRIECRMMHHRLCPLSMRHDIDGSLSCATSLEGKSVLGYNAELGVGASSMIIS